MFVLSIGINLSLGFDLAEATLEIPRNLSQDDRIKATEILGLSSSTKLLGNPYPLGGFSGIEVGYSTEIIATSELSRLGNKTSSQGETSYQVFTIGKGLYNNIDLFFQFAPETQAEAIWGFGGQLRWGLFQAEYLPAYLTLVISANSTSFQNKINVVTQGTDLVAGFNVDDVTLYTGLGVVRAIGTFVGGGAEFGVTDSGNTAQADVTEPHYLAGVNLKISKAFLAMEIDRYTQATYSAKLGVRF